MELLSEILRSTRVTGSVYFCNTLEAPWRQSFGHLERASFHMIRRGQCWLEAEHFLDRLGPGDFVFAGPGKAHILRSEEGTVRGEQKEETLLLCGYCRFEPGIRHPLLAQLPELTIVRAEELQRHTWLKSTLDQLSSEYLAQQPGSEVVVDKLTEVLLVELIRSNFARSDRQGFIGALYDKHLSKALSLLHAEPHKPWTIEQLARSVALSRAALAKRFKQRVGQTMFEYLTNLRMRKAQDLLRSSGTPLYQVAAEVGYESELAFTKAFKRLFGTTPTRYRRSRAPEGKSAQGEPG